MLLNYNNLTFFFRWSSPASEVNVPVRLLMLRDSDTKGKKLLFDSMTTKRHLPPLPNGYKLTDYDQITDGIGYQVRLHVGFILTTKNFGNKIIG